MTFETNKKTFLLKLDKSKKGSIDKNIKPLINKINKSPNYYTTSSCSGRIVLISKSSERKQDAEWLLVSHTPINFKQVKKALCCLPKTAVWFRFEPLILHVTSRTLEDAQQLLSIAKDIGFKRSGIQSTKRKITLEIASTEIIDTIIADKGSLLVTDDYLKILIKQANKKLKRNNDRIKKFYNLFLLHLLL